jgi:hypothetical protein
MKSTRTFFLWLVAAAWLFTGVAVQAQSNADAVLSLDYVGNDLTGGNGTDDGVTSGVVAGAGTSIVVEIFAAGVTANLTGASITLTADQSIVRLDPTVDAAGTSSVLAGSFALALPGTDSTQSVGAFGPTALTNDLVARVGLITVADVTDQEFSIDIAVNLAVSTSDSRTINASMSFNAVPKVVVDSPSEEIPRGGVSPTITATASNFAAGATITISAAKTDGAADISLTDNGDGTATITASGSGFATADITASDGTTTTSAVSVMFSEQVPAELAAFGGSIVDEGVSLNWTTTSQTNNAGWQVMRSTDGITYEVVSDLVLGAGTSDAVLNYDFEDTAIPSIEKVFYRLDQVDLDGAIHSSAPIEVILGARFLDLPNEFGTHVYPNPFNPATTIAYDLPSDSAVSIVIYDALGQEIRRLVTEQKAAGRYTIQWDALDNLGRGVGSGVYIAKVEAGQFSASQKMLLLK